MLLVACLGMTTNLLKGKKGYLNKGKEGLIFGNNVKIVSLKQLGFHVMQTWTYRCEMAQMIKLAW